MKRIHIKKRTAVGAMAFIMLVTYAVPGFGLCHTVSAEENNEPYNTSAGANDSEKVGSLIADMIRTDDGLKKILKGAEAAMNTISIYSPAIKIARLNRYIEQIMNTTPYEWAKMHPGYTKGAYIMTDTGYCDAVTMNTGCALKYYYRGVRLQDTTCGIRENRYLYKSEGFDTTIRNESIAPMYYLAPAIV